MRINQIQNLENKCTGCVACVDVCPAGCINKETCDDGFVYTKIDENKCIDCGKCYKVCPIENNRKNSFEQSLYAVYSCSREIRNGGSSGGMFEMLASYFLKQGYYVCGAAFDSDIKLAHRIIKSENELNPLLKSKYVQSDMSGVYQKILGLLKNGNKVFFCGTP